MVYVVCTCILFCRVFKQTLRSAGSTLTTRHVEDVSLGVLFLFEAAKKTDKAFKSAPQSTAHTAHSAQDDISNMVGHLLAKQVTTVVQVEMHQLSLTILILT